MNKQKKIEQSLKAKREMILEMIDASWKLAERLGKHPLRNGCNCIACVNKRKRLLNGTEKEWTYSI